MRSTRHSPATVLLAALVLIYGLGFGWLAVERHLTLRTNAEDLGFTDQVIWNFLRGQAFRFSLYEQAEFETDVDLASLKRPDSLLAFHVEPFLVLLAPLYLVVPDVRAILWLQAALVALGAIPTFRFAHRRLGSDWAALSAASAYLLAPLGQWALYSDFHAVTLAAPLLMLAIDALDEGRALLFLASGLLAASTKEEIGLSLAGLGVLALLRARTRRAGLVAVGLGVGWSLLCVGVIIPNYAGTAISPFTARYGYLGDGPVAALTTLVQQPSTYLEALSRPEVLGYAATLVLSGGWLAVLAPELIMPTGLVLGLNVLSSSPWMSSGRAHYSASILPFLIAAAVVGMARLSGWERGIARLRAQGPTPTPKAQSPILLALSALLVVSAVVGYRRSGGGAFADGFVVPTRLPRHALAAQLAASIPRDAAVSASTTLFPHVSQRASAYLFPTLRDADYVLVDVGGNAFPISPGGLHLRVQELLGSGQLRLVASEDGIMLLEREAAASRPLPDSFFDFARVRDARLDLPTASYLDGAIDLVRADLVPSGDLGPRGPLATLETTWRLRAEVHDRPRPSLHAFMKDGTEQRFHDLPTVWWYPPEQWRPGELVRIDVGGLPLREVVRWEAEVRVESPAQGTSPPPEPTPAMAGPTAEPLPAPALALPGPMESPPPPAEVGPNGVSIRLGELTAQIEQDPWRLSLLGPDGTRFWHEAPLESRGDRLGPLGYRDAAGNRWHLVRLLDVAPTADGVRVAAATDEPNGRTAAIELRSLGPRVVRMSFTLSDSSQIAALGGAFVVRPDERFLGFGERFDGVDQRGRIVWNWSQDRRDVGFGEATYAPIPFCISSRGYSLLIESDARAYFDVAESRADRFAWEVQRPATSLVLAYGPSPRDLVQTQAGLAGLPPLPPIWAFGVWKTAVGGQSQVVQDARRLREQGLPVSGLLLYDAPDQQALLGWPFIGFAGKQAGPYPDLGALNDDLHRLGYKTLGYKNADLSARVPTQAATALQGLAVLDHTGGPYVHPHHLVSWVDFTNPDAVAWWDKLWRRILADLRFDGAMLDLGELVPEDARYADGTTGIETHNRYLTLYAQASYLAARSVRGDDFAIFARSASLGAQRFQSLQWSGDQTVTWGQDGIRGLVPAALSIGLSGYPYWHPEVGGYLDVGLPRPSERELWFRWLQLGALSPLLRDNYGEHQGDPVETWSDTETVDAFRRYARLHNSLVPYLYSQARIAAETGLPIMRHLALIAPNDPRAWAEEYEYTLGDDLLVAPVLEEGSRLRTLYLPAGTWVDWWTGQFWEGGRTVTVDAPLDQIPIFARAGAILPLATDFDTLAPAADPSIVRWGGDLVVRVVTPTLPTARGVHLPEASQRLYDGTLLRTEVDGRALTLSAELAPAERTYELHLPSPDPPARVLLNDAPADGWSYRDGIVRLTLRAASFRLTIQP
ncbi:MAG TPA: DUF2079 domain-containing protein [Chloroflexota bacterium]|nr:DUF2079 domain-containing protein [Chloroflexota bacterium]